VRISGVVAAVFCLGGLYLFSRYDEKKVMAETEEMKAKLE